MPQDASQSTKESQNLMGGMPPDPPRGPIRGYGAFGPITNALIFFSVENPECTGD